PAPGTGCRPIETIGRPGPVPGELFVRRLSATVPWFETGRPGAARLRAAGLRAAGFLEAARFVRRRCTGAGVVAVPLVDAQLLLHHPHFLQMLEHFRRHAVGQVDQAVVVADAEAADELAVQPGFVGDRTDDVARLDAVLVADLDAVGALAFLGGMRAHRALAELARRRTLVRGVFAWPMFGGPRFARRWPAAAASRGCGGRRSLLARSRGVARSTRWREAGSYFSRFGGGASSSGWSPWAMRASAAAISTAGTLCSCSYCSISCWNWPRSPCASMSLMRCLNLPMRTSLTTSTDG